MSQNETCCFGTAGLIANCRHSPVHIFAVWGAWSRGGSMVELASTTTITQETTRILMRTNMNHVPVNMVDSLLFEHSTSLRPDGVKTGSRSSADSSLDAGGCSQRTPGEHDR